MPWKLVAEYRTPITFWMLPMVTPAGQNHALQGLLVSPLTAEKA